MEKRTLILLFTLVLDIIGIAFLGVGIGLCIRGRKKRSTCTKLVAALLYALNIMMSHYQLIRNRLRYELG